VVVSAAVIVVVVGGPQVHAVVACAPQACRMRASQLLVVGRGRVGGGGMR
jgi:hypothetical protein